MTTYEIVLCDDDAEQLIKIDDMLEEYKCEENSTDMQFKTVKFYSAEELLDWFDEKTHKPDLMIVDIYLSGRTGIEAVKELRKNGEDTPVVFLTTSKEHALNAYEVDAIQYLVKPLEKEKFYHMMHVCIKAIHKRHDKGIVFKTGNGYRQLMQDEIIYCESERNYQIVHLKEEFIKVRITAKEMFEKLQKYPQFIRCGTSYIVNIHHIISVNKDEVRMDNDTGIFIPKSREAEFKKQYFEYYFSDEE